MGIHWGSKNPWSLKMIRSNHIGSGVWSLHSRFPCVHFSRQVISWTVTALDLSVQANKCWNTNIATYREFDLFRSSLWLTSPDSLLTIFILPELTRASTVDPASLWYCLWLTGVPRELIHFSFPIGIRNQPKLNLRSGRSFIFVGVVICTPSFQPFICGGSGNRSIPMWK